MSCVYTRASVCAHVRQYMIGANAKVTFQKFGYLCLHCMRHT